MKTQQRVLTLTVALFVSFCLVISGGAIATQPADERENVSSLTVSQNSNPSIMISVTDSANGMDSQEVAVSIETTAPSDVPEIPNVDQQIVNGVAQQYGDETLGAQDILFAWDDYQSGSLDVSGVKGQDILFLWDGYQNLNN